MVSYGWDIARRLRFRHQWWRDQERSQARRYQAKSWLWTQTTFGQKHCRSSILQIGYVQKISFHFLLSVNYFRKGIFSFYFLFIFDLFYIFFLFIFYRWLSRRRQWKRSWWSWTRKNIEEEWILQKTKGGSWIQSKTASHSWG